MKPRQSQNWAVLLAVSAVVAGVVHLVWGGSLVLSLPDLARGLSEGPGSKSTEAWVIWQLRLPRMVACLVTGGILGVVGASFRSFFRNPLAEPYVLGVASGSAAAGTLVVLVGWSTVLGGAVMLGAGALGGMLTLFAVFVLAGGLRGRLDVVRLLLAGVVVGSMLSAVLTLLLLMAGQDTNQVLRWLLGSMTPMYWPKVGALVGVLVLGCPVLYVSTRALNVVTLEGDQAGRMGVDPKQLAAKVLGVGTVMVGVAVGSVGIIGFVGLVAPHIARLMTGPDLRKSLPISGLVGAVLLTVADFGAQKILPGGELPVGAVTALVGAPVLLWIAGKSRERLG